MPFAAWGRWLALFVILVAQASAAADAPPRVLGFERLRAMNATDAKSGQLLLGELNCISCHQANTTQAKLIERKAAPVLDTVGSRVRPQYLLQFLNNPQQTKPGTTMPHVLARVPENERAVIVEELVHFLAGTGTLEHANPSRHGVNRGDTLFHSVGCLACHDPRGASPPISLNTSLPLGTPSRKYTLPGLMQFIADPLAVRPGGRMPHLNLSPGEARDVASFLLNDLDLVSGLQYAYYEGDWQKLPDFSKLTPVAVGEAESFDLGVAKRRDHFALRFEGTILLPQDGDYLFLIGSDDGSRLLIDDKPVVVNEGIHPFEQKRKKVAMKAGTHAIAVEYFEHNGEESLQLDFEAPGGQQQPLATVLTSPAKSERAASSGELFAVDRSKAARGKQHFAKLGCASCHTLRVDGSPIASELKAKPLADLASSGGCLKDQDANTPRYALDASQKKAIAAALSNAGKLEGELPAEELVQRTLARFHCVACHERNSAGGVEEARNTFFQSDMPEMGDEGRLPPSLTGVGAKLTIEWLQSLFERGADDRSYMLTRMPKFGLTNVGSLVHALPQADASRMQAAPSIHPREEDARRIKAGGRRLVGSQGFSCIKCHTFAGQRSSGIQAISLTTMTQRLRPEWFHHYLQNPLAYRPGTRMPTPFPDGQTTLPGVLDGTVPGQIAAIWQYLSDGDKAMLPVGLVTGKIELMAFDEPVIFRNFIEGAGTRAIGVGYAEKLNLAFDAENLRLALLWNGAFIDAARHWTARGQGYEKPLGDNVLQLPAAPAWAQLADDKTPWPETAAKAAEGRFQGYRLDEKRRPVFMYSVAGLLIEDLPRPAGEQDLFVLQRTLRIASQTKGDQVSMLAARGGTIEKAAERSYLIDSRWTLHVSAETKPLVRHLGGQWELLIPVTTTDGSATLELTYDW